VMDPELQQNIVIANRLGAAGSFDHMSLGGISCLEFWNREVCDVEFTLF
jgi:hypothetical protein